MRTRETLRYAVANSNFGKILVAESDKGVRTVLIEQTSEDLVRALSTACPNADIQQNASLEKLAAKIARHIENPASELNIKLDPRGNDFQTKVWNALRKIPAGTTISYGKIAEQIGAPGAARAVGSACAANTIAVLIPCHRVVKSDGGISGYRWGPEIKRRLLEIEKRLSE